MFYLIDYNDTDMFIRPYIDGATELVVLQDGYTRLQINSDADLDAVDKELLLRVANVFCPATEETCGELPPEPSRVIWGLLTEIQEEKHVTVAPAATETPNKKREKSKKIAQKSSDTDLEKASEGGTSDVPQGNVLPDTTKEGPPMAKSKKSAAKSVKAKAKVKVKVKKAAKPKSAKATSNGLPREGSKKAKLLAAVTKPGGATMKQLIALTGWKACRGTLGQVVEAAGKTLSLDKETGRYSAK